ncbi:uncharacterized protein DNG_10313 [Cephalotrichum gorgonifer]|uniref:Uncharacterized protein n=1 Tax=Cephalotrichum gorgonifer TaxID=2041049 RepID=A0AAE8T079_9PEZI|nr:uncharacterized protein DNG_10313 [Cephalotrichum gorgonifer]
MVYTASMLAEGRAALHHAKTIRPILASRTISYLTAARSPNSTVLKLNGVASSMTRPSVYYTGHAVDGRDAAVPRHLHELVLALAGLHPINQITTPADCDNLEALVTQNVMASCDCLQKLIWAESGRVVILRDVIDFGDDVG